MNNVVIVGGGTAGWMSAIILSSRFPNKTFTVIDPSSIGAIGVGESVTGVVQMFVNDPKHRLDLNDFFRESDATVKLGIWYKDWMGADTEYLTPIDSPESFAPHAYVEAVEDFYAAAAADAMPLGEAQIFSHLMKANLTDYTRKADGSVTDENSTASCQFDALKFAAWLKKVSASRDNIQHEDEVVTSFKQDSASGHVTHIVTESGREIAGDFFLDCTGFRRLILNQAYNPRWIDYSKHIKLDSAIPSPAPFAEGQSIPVYTQATAMPNGWMWQVPTRSRLGKGYAFSSKYCSDEQAISDMRAAGVDPGDDAKVIRFQPGKLEKQWVGNVCAIGLAGGFIEPLEATTIHVMYVQAMLLAELMLPYYSTQEAAPALAQKFNQLMEVAYNDYVDFVSFHYHTGRNDTEFWRDYQRSECVTDTNQTRMDRWQYTFPGREDFAPTYTQRAFLATSLVVWAPMLSAMGYMPVELGKAAIRQSRNFNACRENVASYLRARQVICSRAVSHEDAIAYRVGN